MDTSPISSLFEDIADKQHLDSVFSLAAFPPSPASRHSPDHGGRFDRSLFQAYVSANKVFVDKILDIFNPDDDLVRVHDFLPTCAMVKRINEKFRNSRYESVVLIDPLWFYKKITYYVVEECCLVSVVKEEMNLIPRQGNEKLNGALGMSSRQGNEKQNGALGTPKKSMLVVTEFIRCSPSLNIASWVNPSNIDTVLDVMDSVLDMVEPEKQL